MRESPGKPRANSSTEVDRMMGGLLPSPNYGMTKSMLGLLFISTLSAPVVVSLSVSSCSDLGWTNAAEYGSATVCGESDLELGKCSGLVTWNEADVYCRYGSGLFSFPCY